MSFSRRAKKATRRSRILIPKRLISVVVVLFSLFILGGGFYNLMNHPPSIIPLSSGYSSLHPYMNEQTSTEGYVVMLINAFSIVGFYMVYHSSLIAYNRSRANMWLVAGIALIVLGFGGNYVLLRLKQALMG